MPAASRKRPSAAEAAAAREARLAELHEQLTEGVAGLRSSAGWQAWLDTAARLPRYSFRNLVMLEVQLASRGVPAGSELQMAGYQAWRALGRQVRKGEKALYVLAPIVSRHPRGATGEESPEAVEDAGSASPRRLVGFKPAAVSAYHQTEGPELARPPRPELLAGQAPDGLWDALTEVVASRGFTVTRCPDAAAIGGANGITDFLTRSVTVRADVDDAAACKVLAHEAGHVLLHDQADVRRPACRGSIEVEAESVAYIVGGHHGLDTSGYSFAYIAGWAPDDQTVTATAERVLAAARTIIDITDPQPGIDLRTAAKVAELAATAGDTVIAAEAAALAAHQLCDQLVDQPQRILAVNAGAQAWFTSQTQASGEFAEAIRARGHTTGTAVAYGVGYAPNGWTGLVDHLHASGFDTSDLLAAGVATRSSTGRIIDRFRGRVTFPIRDPGGEVIGFTARDITGNLSAAKYVNTHTNAVYDKGAAVQGLEHVCDQTRQVVLVEGPMDGLAVTTADAGSVGVAACGTAVTATHLDALAATGRDIVLAMDADSAGLTALGRITDQITARTGAQPAAIHLPAGADPATVFSESGPAALAEALAHPEPAGVVYARTYLDLHPAPSDHAEARVAHARAAAAHLTGLSHADRAKVAAMLLADTGISVEAVQAIVAPAAPKVPTQAAALPAHPRPHQYCGR